MIFISTKTRAISYQSTLLQQAENVVGVMAAPRALQLRSSFLDVLVLAGANRLIRISPEQLGIAARRVRFRLCVINIRYVVVIWSRGCAARFQ